MATKGSGRINFTKLGMAVIDELTQILRDLLSNEVKPTIIAKVVKRSTSLPRFRPEQEILVKKANTAGYTDFDTTLLYTLLRNECPNIPPPTNGWGRDPGPTDTTVGDDIERIRLIRNKVLGHISTTTVTDAEFQSLWTEMELICQRMESHLGSHKNYVQHLQQIEMQSVDEQLENMYTEKLQIMLQNEKELKENLQEMKEEMQQTKKELKEETQQTKKELIKEYQETKDMITETLSSKIDDLRSDVEQLKEKDKYKAVTKVTMEVVPEKKAKQEDVNSLLQIQYEMLLDIVHSIQEDSSTEYVFQRWKEIEKHGYKIEDKDEFPAFFEIIYKFKVKISRFAEMDDVIGFSIFSQFLNFVRIMREKKGQLEVEHSSLILYMIFQSEEDLKSYQKDVQNGTIESHLSECLLFQPLLSIFDLNSTDVIMKVTDITEAGEKKNEIILNYTKQVYKAKRDKIQN